MSQIDDPTSDENAPEPVSDPSETVPPETGAPLAVEGEAPSDVVEPATEPEPGPEPVAEAEPMVEPAPVVDPEPVAEPGGELVAEAGPEPEPEPEAEPEPVVEAEPEPVVEAEPEPAPVAQAEPAAAAEEEVDAAVHDPFRGPGDWYVVHTYAGYENKVKTNLESRIHTMQMEDKIFDVHIPMEDVMEIKGGKKQVVQRKVFPGYLLVKMIYDNDSWYVVRNTPGVTGFVAAGTGSKPTPLSRREVEKILAVKKEEVKPQFRLGFEEQDVVRIISGPFADFNGTISEINLDQSKLKVLVNIFDRETPVELSFDQVAKV
jgi:transcriptional antiterminator NusG